MKRNKKAQTSEIFFFILAIVIIGLLLLFGVKYIMELGSKVNQIELVQFKTDLENSAEEYRPVYGKWKKLTFSVPVGILKVCFVQHETFTAASICSIVTGRFSNALINPCFNFSLLNGSFRLSFFMIVSSMFWILSPLTSPSQSLLQ